MVPPPAPSVNKIMSPIRALTRAVKPFSLATPTPPTQPVSRSPITMSPPIRKVLPVISGTFMTSDTCLLYTSPSPETKANLVCRLLLEKKKKKKVRLLGGGHEEWETSTQRHGPGFGK